MVDGKLWALTKATDAELSQLVVMRNELIDRAMSTPDSSERRLLLTIIERLGMTEDELRVDFLDHCLEHMMRPDERPAAQALCMKIAFRMSKFHPELMDELRRTLEAMEVSYYTPAVKSVRNRILGGRMK